MKITPIEFKNNLKQTLRGYVHEPKKYDTAIIHLHGFPGHMAHVPKKMCNTMSKKGILSMRFDFSGTDTSDGKFEDKLTSQEVKDIKYAIDFLFKNYTFKKFVLLGHSSGSIAASLYAYKDKRINKLVLMGVVSNMIRCINYDFYPETIKDFWTKGYTVYKSDRKAWYDKKKLKKAYYDEFFKLKIEDSMKKYRGPTLILHGTEDEAVPVKDDPIDLYKVTNKPKKLVLIKGANHGFKKRKHWKQLTKEIEKFVKK